MKVKKFIKDLFKDEPIQWGLRGDPEMWSTLKSSFENELNIYSQLEFENEITNRFNTIIKSKGKRNSIDTVWFEGFSQKGMSGGYISLEWWEQTGLPLLKNRYFKFNE